MIHDKLLQFSRDQALTATAASTDYIDLSADRDIGAGRPMWLIVFSKAAPDGTSPTLAISIETDDNPSFASASTLVTHPTIAGASFPVGTRVVIPMPFANERYLRVKYTLAGDDPEFTVDAFLTDQAPYVHHAYPDASQV
jgi:hypothetical protein